MTHSNNKTAIITVLAAISIALTTTGCTRIGPGHVGIVVESAGSNKGVLEAPVKTGWVWYNPISETVVEYPTFQQTVKWTKNVNEGNPADESMTFTNADSMVINADVSLSYSLIDTKVPKFYVKFLSDDLTRFTHGFMKNVVRDCLNEHAGHYKIEQIMGDNAPFLKEARGCIQQENADWLTIEQFGFIGAPRPPQNVIDSINLKAQAQQIALQKQNEVVQVQADANKNVAQAEGDAKAAIARAQGEAEANRIKSASITPNLLLWRSYDNQGYAIQKWNGQMPTMLSGGDKNSNFLMQIPNK
jgi:regulator of protease activity HflC (stomatin/prohibitin superfamily)